MLDFTHNFSDIKKGHPGEKLGSISMLVMLPYKIKMPIEKVLLRIKG